MNKMTVLGCCLCTTLLMVGCAGGTGADKPQGHVDSPAIAPAAPTAPVVPVAPAVQAAAVVRIKAGLSSSFTDSAGNVWLPDQGFEGGDVIERPNVEVANAKDQGLYRSEHYGMSAFSRVLPNGKYLVKLHFAETFEGINGPGERVFSFSVQGKEFKDFDVWKKAGGPLKAYVETVDVEVVNGSLLIKFAANVENPQINAIEILPLK